MSTGPGKQMAEDLKHELRSLITTPKIEVVATEHRGHAEELAYSLARASKQPLIISASGDGGYNEVVNGVLRAQQAGNAQPVAGLLPSGNANDHYRETHKGDVASAIARTAVQTIDVLKLESTIDSKPFARYAHSYIGFGLTPQAGRELNKKHLNRLNEIGIVLRVLFNVRPIQLQVAGKTQTYDSLIFSNVSTMSKVLTVADSASNTDGKFDVVAFRRRNKLKLIGALLRATTTGLSGNERTEAYSFKTTKPTLVQLDGEVYKLDSTTQVTISLEHRVLQCIV